MKYHYIGCFLPFEKLMGKCKELKLQHLERVIRSPHVTFVYEPDSVDESLFGEKVEIKVIGYGNNGINEGFQVEIFSSNERIVKMARRIPVPHITLSVGEHGKPVDTKKLDFAPIEEFMIEGWFGGYPFENEQKNRTSAGSLQ